MEDIEMDPLPRRNSTDAAQSCLLQEQEKAQAQTPTFVQVEEDHSILRDICKRGTAKELEKQLETIDPNVVYQNSSPINWSAESGNVNTMRVLLNDGRLLDIKNGKKYKRTALHLAAKNGNHEVIKLLLADEGRIDVNAVDKQKRTAFHLAAESPVQDGTEDRFIRCLILLMQETELEINRPDTFGRTALARAVQKSHRNRVLAILKYHGDKRLNLDYFLIDGGKTIRAGILDKFPEFEEYLPDKLVEDINSEDPKIKLFAALQNNLLDQFNEILQNNEAVGNSSYQEDTGNSSFQEKVGNSTFQEETGNSSLQEGSGNSSFWNSSFQEPYHCSCLELACMMEGRWQFVAKLLSLGCNPNIKNDISQLPLLHITAEKLNLEALRELVRSRELNLSIQGLYKGTVLHWLAMNKCGEDPGSLILHQCVSLLLQSNQNQTSLNINALDDRKDTPLHVAIRWDNLNFALVLLSNMASVEQWNDKNHTPLHIAALHGSKDSIITLLKHGADINAKRDGGTTPLHLAIQQRKQDLVLLLLKQGANFLYEEHDKPALNYIDANTLQTFLDDCIECNNKSPRDTEYMLTFKYHFIPPIKDLPDTLTNLEMSPLLKMSDIPELRSILKHPILSSILHVKWSRACWIFYLNIILYSGFLVFLTLRVFLIKNTMKLGTNATNSSNFNITANDTDSDTLNPINIMLIIFLFLVAVREVLQFVTDKKEYKSNPGNLKDILIIVLTGIISFGLTGNAATQHIASYVILLAWIEFLLLIGQLPSVSVQLQMLKTVCWTFFKFGLCYSPLLLAFGFSFNILFHGHVMKTEEVINNIGNGFWSSVQVNILSIFKTFVMFTGEFELGDLNFHFTPVSSHIVFFLFVFLVALALLNLLNGLAVSDTKTIRDDAETLSLVARAKLVHRTERSLVHIQNIKFIRQYIIKKYCFFFGTLPFKRLYVYPNRNSIFRFESKGKDKGKIDKKIKRRATIIAKTKLDDS